MNEIKHIISNKKSGIILFALSFWVSFSLVYTFSYSGDVFAPIVPVLAIVLFGFISYAKVQIEANYKKFSLLPCVVLSLFTSCALHLSSDVMAIFEKAFSSFFSVALFSFSVLGLAILICCLYALFCVKFIESDFIGFDKKATIIDFFAVWVAIFVCWIFVWMCYFPGISTPDTYTQMHICAGNIPLSNNHPFLHTMLVYITTRLTDFNPWLYVLVQMLVMSGVYAYLCYWMKKKNVWKWLWIVTVAFFALFPVHPYNAITMVKDSLFSAFVLVYSLIIYEVVSSNGEWLKKSVNIIKYVLVAVLVTLFRSNGIMVVFLTVAICLMLLKEKRMRFVLTNAVSISLYALVVYIIYPAIGVAGTSISEAMAIPLQQLCCAIAEECKLSDNIINYMNEILPIEQIKLSYDPETVDTIKFHDMYNGSIIANDLTGFLKIWFAGLLEQPLVYVKAYLAEIEGLWNPVMKVGVFEPYQAPKFFMNAEIKPLLPLLSKVYDVAVNVSYLSRYAFFSRVFYNPAVYYTVVFLCGVVMKAKNKLSYASVMLPVLSLWISVAVSMPRATVGRYVYAVFACVPLIVFVVAYAVKYDNNSDKI